jgi:amidase
MQDTPSLNFTCEFFSTTHCSPKLGQSGHCNLGANDCSDDPLYADSLKHALYRSAAAELLDSNLSKTKEPWPRGYGMLEDLVASMAKSQEGEKQDIRTAAGPVAVAELWQAQLKRTEYAKKMLNAWAATKARTGTGREIDALLMPCTPWPACSK